MERDGTNMSSRIEPSIRSRPTYGRLEAQDAPAHLLMADAEGGAAIAELVGRAPAGFVDTAEILYVPGAGEADGTRVLEALGCPRLYIGPSVHAALPRLRRSLERARMGTRLYLAGSEGLIGLAMREAMAAGHDHQGIQTEHRGTLARRVQCVHCKGVTEEVTTQPVECAHCGLLLLVRDHYSRRLAAFQGVNVNAEDPSEVPPIEEVFR